MRNDPTIITFVAHDDAHPRVSPSQLALLTNAISELYKLAVPALLSEPAAVEMIFEAAPRRGSLEFLFSPEFQAALSDQALHKALQEFGATLGEIKENAELLQWVWNVITGTMFWDLVRKRRSLGTEGDGDPAERMASDRLQLDEAIQREVNKIVKAASLDQVVLVTIQSGDRPVGVIVGSNDRFDNALLASRPPPVQGRNHEPTVPHRLARTDDIAYRVLFDGIHERASFLASDGSTSYIVVWGVDGPLPAAREETMIQGYFIDRSTLRMIDAMPPEYVTASWIVYVTKATYWM